MRRGEVRRERIITRVEELSTKVLLVLDAGRGGKAAEKRKWYSGGTKRDFLLWHSKTPAKGRRAHDWK